MAEQQDSKWEQEMLKDAVLASVTEQRRGRRWGIFFKLLILAYVVFVTFAFYSQSNGVSSHAKDKEHVGLIDIDGEIGAGKDVEADQVATSLKEAFESENIKGLILRINSPGGSPVQSDYIYNEIKRQREKHPEIKVYGVISDIGASGAYYIAAASDYIYANRSSLVGSIGVLLPNFGFTEVMQKVGVEQRSLMAGDNKMLLDPFSQKNEKQTQFAQSVIDNVHKHFINAVKEGRGDRLASNKDHELFSGLFWSGEQAKELGLIDGFGSAGFVAREIFGTDEIVDYTLKPNFFEMLGLQMGVKFQKAIQSAFNLNLNSKHHPEIY
jgi:protease-4